VSRTTIDPTDVLAQYEVLREEAISTRCLGAHGCGLAILLSRGLPAWVAALTALAPAPRPKLSAPAAVPGRGPRLVPAARTELTAVLAGMVLACTGSSKEG